MATVQAGRRARHLSTSPFSRAFVKKSLVAAAAQQLGFIPEYKRVEEQAPLGRYGGAHARAPNALCASAAADAGRVVEICANMPVGSGGRNAYLEAALRRSVSRSESCGDLVAARKGLAALSQMSRVLAGGADGADLDSLDGAARADVAEVLLAAARVEFAGVPAGSPSVLPSVASALALSSSASSVSDELTFAQAKGDAGAVAALLPAALAHARAHALAILVSKLTAGITTVESHAAPSDPEERVDGRGGAAGGAGRPADVPIPVEQAHLQQVVQACQAADEAITRCMHTTGVDKESSAMSARFVHGRTAVIRASARRNLAAVHLLTAVAHMSASGGASARGAARTGAAAPAPVAAIPYNSQYALAHLSAAHAQLTSALEHVNLACTRHRDITAGSRAGGHGAGGRAARSTDDAGGRSGSAPPPPPPLTRGVEANPAWVRLGWDLRACRADVAASTAEVGTMLALWTIWMPGASQLGGGDGQRGGAAPSSSSSPDTLFPLDATETDAVAPVMKTASAAAEAALRDYEAIDAAMAGGGGEGVATLPAFSDHGLDPGVCLARALRCIGVLQHYAMKSVTAEGLFRAALDKYEGLHLSNGRVGGGAGAAQDESGSGSLGGLDDAVRGWSTLPALHAGGVAGVLLPYAALLRQWEKREREGERLAAHGASLLRAACTPYNIVPPPPTTDARVDYVAQQTLSIALCTAHVGSWGLVTPHDFAVA